MIAYLAIKNMWWIEYSQGLWLGCRISESHCVRMGQLFLLYTGSPNFDHSPPRRLVTCLMNCLQSLPGVWNMKEWHITLSTVSPLKRFIWQLLIIIIITRHHAGFPPGIFWRVVHPHPPKKIIFLKFNLLGEKGGLYMLVLLASPRWRWCLGEYILVPYRKSCCMKPTKYSPGHQSHLGEANKTNI